MKKKIFLFYLILVVIGVAITGFFTSRLSQRFYKQEVETRLVSNALLLSEHFTYLLKTTSVIDYNDEAERFSSILTNSSHNDTYVFDTRITVVSYDGTVLGDSDADYSNMENHLTRPEIKKAVSNGFGINTRYSDTLNVNLVYAAVALPEPEIIIRIAIPLYQLKEMDTIIWGYAVMGIIAGILFTALLAFKFSNSITKPIKQLISMSEDISSGIYTGRADISTKDEIGQLTNTFNEMSSKLQKTIMELKDKNIKLDSVMNSMVNGLVAVDSDYKILLINQIACTLFNTTDKEAIGSNLAHIIRNKKINDMLSTVIGQECCLSEEITTNSSNNKILKIYATSLKPKDNLGKGIGGIISILDITNIRKLEQIRSEFVSNVTHELKTPLTSIRGFVETLRDGAINDPHVAASFLDIIDIEAERLTSLINDILQLSEIESKNTDVNIMNFKLSLLLDETLSILKASADKKSITITSLIDRDLSVTANPNRMKQMLINLIDNAIKYNKTNGFIHITTKKVEGSIEIRIQDSGIGIPEQHHARIFERFYRVNKGRSRDMGGTGLGLSIVKHIVNLYNGNIKIKSALNEGTEFIINLPI